MSFEAFGARPVKSNLSKISIKNPESLSANELSVEARAVQNALIKKNLETPMVANAASPEDQQDRGAQAYSRTSGPGWARTAPWTPLWWMNTCARWY